MYTITITNEEGSSLTRRVTDTYFKDKADSPEYIGMDMLEIVQIIDSKIEF